MAPMHLGQNAGIKTIKIIPGNDWNVTTDDSIVVNVNSTLISGIDFGLKGKTDVYGFDISLTGGTSPRCFSNISYFLTYTNTGTIQTHGVVNYILPSNSYKITRRNIAFC